MIDEAHVVRAIEMHHREVSLDPRDSRPEALMKFRIR